MAAPQKVDATAMQMPVGEPAMLPSQMDSTTPSVRIISDSTSKPVGTCTRMLLRQPFACLCTGHPSLQQSRLQMGSPQSRHSCEAAQPHLSTTQPGGMCRQPARKVGLEVVASVSVTECSMTIPRMAVMIGMPERMIWLRDRLISTRLALLATMLATCRHQRKTVHSSLSLHLRCKALETSPSSGIFLCPFWLQGFSACHIALFFEARMQGQYPAGEITL